MRILLISGLSCILLSIATLFTYQPAQAQKFSCGEVSEIPKIECEALVALYNSTQGDNWLTHTNWLVTNTPCSWYGVACIDGRVVSIQLYNNQLKGVIPTELGNLVSLRDIYLYGNQLTGQIPKELGNLTNLKNLELSNNQLSGQIPSELGNLKNLVILNLYTNQLSGQIPTELGNLTALQGLALQTNQLTGQIPSELGNLINLGYFYLNENQLTGQIPSELGKLANLGWLFLDTNQLSGQIPIELGNLTKLVGLHLFNNQLTGQLPFSLINIRSLRYFYFYNTSICQPENPIFQNWLKGIKGVTEGNPVFCGQTRHFKVVDPNNSPYAGVNVITLEKDAPAEVTNSQGEVDVYDLNPGDVVRFSTSNGRYQATITITTSLFYTAILQPSCDDVTEIPKIECEALVALYNSTNGNNWITHTNWLETNTPCSWYGITCSERGVIEIRLFSNQLSGQIPTELGNLTNLQILDLHYNPLLSEIPLELSNLSNLQELNLASTGLKGKIPKELGNLTNLNYLILDEGGLSGEIPKELGNLTNLNYLSLFSNQISGSIPMELGNLTNLRSLYLQDNQLTGQIPKELGNLTNLQQLGLSSNQLNGQIPKELGNLTNLQQLDLFYNQLTGQIPNELGNLSNLQFLHLQSNQLTGQAPKELGNLTNLQQLDLSYNQLNGQTPKELGNLTNLQQLNISFNQLTGQIPFSFMNLKGLRYFLFYNTSICQPENPTFQNWLKGIEGAGGNAVFCGQTRHFKVVDSDNSPYTGVNVITLEKDAPAEVTNSQGEVDVYDLNPGDVVRFSTSNGRYQATITITTNLFYTAILQPSCDDVTEIPKTECEALVSLYNSTNGNNWITHTNWLETNTPCSWYGITCGEGHVIRIQLIHNNLIGQIPIELGNLLELRYFYLGDNELFGQIPKELGNLTNLIELSLFFNQLTKKIPKELSNINKLNYLDLSHNQLTDTIPIELGNLTNLRFLYLQDNQLTGSIPKQLGNITNVITISLYSNQLSGSIPMELGNLTNLRFLYLQNNQLTGSIPTQLGNLTNLQNLYLSNNQLTGYIPNELAKLTNLQWLSLDTNKLGGQIPIGLGNLTKLVRLNLFNNQLTGELHFSLTNIKSLRYFYFYNTSICQPENPIFQNWLKGIEFVEGNTIFCGQTRHFTVVDPYNSPYAGVNVRTGDKYTPIEVTNYEGEVDVYDLNQGDMVYFSTASERYQAVISVTDNISYTVMLQPNCNIKPQSSSCIDFGPGGPLTSTILAHPEQTQEVNSNDGLFQLFILANSVPLTEGIYTSVRTGVNAPSFSGQEIVGVAYEVNTVGVSHLSRPAILSLSVDDLPSNILPTHIGIFHWEENSQTWQRVPDSSISSDGKYLFSKLITELGIYAIFKTIKQVYLPVLLQDYQNEVTPTPTPIYTPTPSLPCYTEEFNRNDPNQVWTVSEDSQALRDYENGAYYILPKNTKVFHWAKSPLGTFHNTSNYSVQVDVHWADSGNYEDEEYGIAFDLITAGNEAKNTYLFNVNSHQKTYALRLLPDKNKPTTLITQTTSTFIHDGNATNTLKIERVENDKINLYINGQYEGSLEANRFIGAVSLGINVRPSDFGVRQAYFDNFTICSEEIK